MKEKVTMQEGIFLVSTLLAGSILVISSTGQFLGKDVWLAMVLGLGGGLLLIGLNIAVAKLYPHDCLGLINQKTFGPFLGKIVNFLYVLYFFIVLLLCLWSAVSFWTSVDMVNTPKWVFYAAIIFLAAAGLYLGFNSIMKLAVFIGIVLSIMAILGTACLVPVMDWQRFFPLLTFDWKSLLMIAGLFYCLTFAGLETSLLYLPQLPVQNIKKIFMLGFLIGGGYILLSYVRNVLVLGNSISVLSYANLQTLRMLDFGNFLRRLEVPTTLTILSVVIAKIMLLFHSVISFLAESCGKADYHKFILPVCVVVAVIVVFFDKNIARSPFQMGRIVVFAIVGGFNLLLLITYLIGKKKQNHLYFKQ